MFSKKARSLVSTLISDHKIDTRVVNALMMMKHKYEISYTYLLNEIWYIFEFKILIAHHKDYIVQIQSQHSSSRISFILQIPRADTTFWVRCSPLNAVTTRKFIISLLNP